LETKERVIRTALEVFLERGYERTSMREIAHRAGVTKGGIYHYFQGKEHLFREALSFITQQMEEWSGSQFRFVNSAKDLLAQLFGSIKSMSEAFAGIVGERAKEQPYSFLEILVTAVRRDEGARRKMMSIYSDTRQNIAKILVRAQERGEIKNDIDCEVLSFQINALMEGTLLLSVLDGTVDLDTIGEQMYRNIWRTIRNPDYES
jgi:AcrR family transcriptional regulator